MATAKSGTTFMLPISTLCDQFYLVSMAFMTQFSPTWSSETRHSTIILWPTPPTSSLTISIYLGQAEARMLPRTLMDGTHTDPRISLSRTRLSIMEMVSEQVRVCSSADGMQIVSLLNPIAPTCLSKTCGVTAPTGSQWALWDNTLGNTTQSKISTFSMPQCIIPVQVTPKTLRSTLRR